MNAADLREEFRRDRFLAHRVLFGHRHEHPFAPFHRDLVEDFWSLEWAYIDLGFRECGKTTLVEEAIALAACEGAFNNCVIVGAKEALAAELLASVKVELEQNEGILALYGEVRGDTWQQTRVTLRDGRCIQAIGRDQSLRGTKHREWRPDLVVINDFEDDEEVLTPEGRRRTLRWLLRVLLPACDRRRRRIRIYDTVRDAESVPMMLIRHRGWAHRLIPISYLDEEGEERSSWPGHPTLTPEWIAAERKTYAVLGEMDIWEREYMMNAVSHADRTFRPEMIRIEPQVRAWQAVYAMIDPARTVGAKSAFTGWAVWSWVRNRLIVWEAGAKALLPDEIVDLAFRISGDYAPVAVGIEEDGLNEWLAQPIRHEQLKRRLAIPYRGVRAPRGKDDFIRGLQPFFAAGEVLWVRELPELREELLQFPTGRKDAPNALAYALNLRPGKLVYDGFNPHVHVAEVEAVWEKPCWLAANAGVGAVSAVLVQLVGSQTLVLDDWVAEGDAGEVLEGMVREAWLRAPQKFTLVAGERHWRQYGNAGLVQAARRLGIECCRGGDPGRGREFLRTELAKSTGTAGSAVEIAPLARWTLNALAGGYNYPLRKGLLSSEPEENRYKVLMEGVESLCGLLAHGEQTLDDRPNVVIDARGRKYISAMPMRGRA